MDGEAGAAGVDGFVKMSGAAALFGELRERNRRRVLLDPASKVFDSRVFGHRAYGVIVTVAVAVPIRPWLSVIVSLTVYVPAAAKVCVGFANAEVLAAPDAGSPKFHA